MIFMAEKSKSNIVAGLIFLSLIVGAVGGFVLATEWHECDDCSLDHYECDKEHAILYNCTFCKDNREIVGVGYDADGSIKMISLPCPECG